MSKIDILKLQFVPKFQLSKNRETAFRRPSIFSLFSLLAVGLVVSVSEQHLLMAQDTVSQFNLDEELKRLEESEKQILNSLSSLQPTNLEVSKDRTGGAPNKLSHDAVIPDNINREIMPDTSVIGVGSTSEPGLGSSFPPPSAVSANQNDAVIDSATAIPANPETGFKELGSIASVESERGDQTSASTNVSQQSVSAQQTESVKTASKSPSIKDDKSTGKLDKSNLSNDTSQQQSPATNTSPGVKDKDLDKEVVRLQAMLESKEQEIKKMRLSESNLKSKIKLYEDEIRRLSDALDEINRNVVLGKCPASSPSVSGARSNFDPTTYSPDGPVPLISVQAGTVVYSGPSRDSIPILTLSEDTSVPKIDSENNWVRIIAPNGVKGWIYRPGSSTHTVASIEQKALDNWLMIGRE